MSQVANVTIRVPVSAYVREIAKILAARGNARQRRYARRRLRALDTYYEHPARSAMHAAYDRRRGASNRRHR